MGELRYDQLAFALEEFIAFLEGWKAKNSIPFNGMKGLPAKTLALAKACEWYRYQLTDYPLTDCQETDRDLLAALTKQSS